MQVDIPSSTHSARDAKLWTPGCRNSRKTEFWMPDMHNCSPGNDGFVRNIFVVVMNRNPLSPGLDAAGENVDAELRFGAGAQAF